MSLPTIEEVVRHVEGLSDEQVTHLTSVLTAREDNMADMFRIAGLQFGLYPEIVAEVFAEVGIGSPIDDTQRQMIRVQFTQLMENLQQQFREGGGS